MVFKELEIQGFKSFPDKVKITFDEGVTGVVGPNGSGKSNLSDAVRWVLGETSARQLRAAGKMEDVIFGGTRRRGAMGFAQVRLTLDNSSHALDVEADEVTIGRRYYRSGESEYSINGQICRLKDVYELLLDTGIGRDGYSVIGQGRIAEIVAAKSSERREIFEEACGIAKYRYRKNEAERRLAAAAMGDFCIALYNPSSKGRPDYLARAVRILLANGKAPGTVCGIVRNIGREGQESRVLTLAALETTPVDMFTTVFVGNAQTRQLSGRMVTPRGYRA